MSRAIQYDFYYKKIIKGLDYQANEAMLKENCNYWACWKKYQGDFNSFRKINDFCCLSPKGERGQKWASARESPKEVFPGLSRDADTIWNSVYCRPIFILSTSKICMGVTIASMVTDPIYRESSDWGWHGNYCICLVTLWRIGIKSSMQLYICVFTIHVILLRILHISVTWRFHLFRMVWSETEMINRCWHLGTQHRVCAYAFLCHRVCDFVFPAV